MKNNIINVNELEYMGELRERRVYAHFETYWHTELTGRVKSTFKAHLIGEYCGPDCNCPYYKAIRVSDRKEIMITKEEDGSYSWGEVPKPPMFF